MQKDNYIQSDALSYVLFMIPKHSKSKNRATTSIDNVEMANITIFPEDSKLCYILSWWRILDEMQIIILKYSCLGEEHGFKA